MDEKDLFLKFWDREAPATRKVISRIPQGTSDYKPEPKSRNAREIAWLIVLEERLLSEGLEKGTIEWKEIPTPATVEEILATYDRNHDDITRRLRALDHSVWEKEFRFMYGDYEISRGTGYHYGWEFLFDAVHHRGQLSTYLRPMGSTVPSIYGPSADEQS
ncbi:MAG TPA: DinB family protein [Blastocatellia bacterium]|nr:DinB family protein [Blastocatellia bacterium]